MKKRKEKKMQIWPAVAGYEDLASLESDTLSINSVANSSEQYIISKKGDKNQDQPSLRTC